MNCGKNYVVKCPLIESLPEAWTYTDTILEDHAAVFFGIDGRSDVICGNQKHILQLFEELSRCNMSRKGLLGVLKDANK